MIDLSDKTMSSILSDMLLRITEQVNKREGSLIRTALSAAAWAIEGLYIELSDVQKQAYGTTATGEYLDLKVAERGLYRHPATNEVCYLKCNLSTLELNFQLGDSSGYTWNVTSEVLSGPDSENLYTYHITCQTEGSIPEPEGELRALSFLAGLVTARFDGVVSYGKDIETDDSLRNRYEESLSEIAFAGNIAAYREKMLELEYQIGQTKATIGALQVYPNTALNGNLVGGNVKIYIVDSNLGVASQSLIDVVQQEICPMYNGVSVGNGYGFAPIGADVHIVSATSTPKLTINITVTLNSSSLEIVTQKIRENVLKYVMQEMLAWGTQVSSPSDVATISIKRAFLYSTALVTGVSNVTSIMIKKDTVEYPSADTVTWDTDRVSMEWINISDVEINVSL